MATNNSSENLLKCPKCGFKSYDYFGYTDPPRYYCWTCGHIGYPVSSKWAHIVSVILGILLIIAFMLYGPF